MCFRATIACLLFVASAFAADRRVLYITTSAGFRHDCLPVTVDVLRGLGQRTGLFDLVHTEDLTVINADSLRGFHAVLFFTSGELTLTDTQKRDLLDWVRSGGSFGGFHSATDTLYSWPAYGELIGGYFDGHPWTQEARVLVTAPDHHITTGLPSPWPLVEEYYQFRNFAAGRANVLLALDTTSVNLRVEGVRASAFPLAWTQEYGAGRVFYTALGHFDGTWTNPVFQHLLENAMRWMLTDTALMSIDAAGNAATMSPLDTIAPGSLITLYGRNLGERVQVNGLDASVLYTSPQQLNARIPSSLSGSTATITVQAANRTAAREVRLQPSTPGIFTATHQPGAVTLWMTGLGIATPHLTATIGGRSAAVLYAGPAPGIPGLDQVNLAVPDGTVAGRQPVVLTVASQPETSARIDVDLP